MLRINSTILALVDLYITLVTYKQTNKLSESCTEGTHNAYVCIQSFRNEEYRAISGLNSVRAADGPDSGGATAEIALKAGFAINSPPSIIQVKCNSIFPSPETYLETRMYRQHFVKMSVIYLYVTVSFKRLHGN
jgi:hypothetical protein